MSIRDTLHSLIVERYHPFTYYGNCVGLPGDAVNDMKDSSRPIMKDAFFNLVGEENLQELFPDYDWGKKRSKFQLKNDWAVSYDASTFGGVPCLFLTHSAIEYVFLKTGKEPKLENVGVRGDFIRSVQEMAVPSTLDKSKTYYHGTNSDAAFKSIKKSGISPQKIEGRNEHGWMTPVTGKVYLTPSLQYALIYALGGDMIGGSVSGSEDYLMKSGRYGYVLVVPGDLLVDIQPDEDAIGGILSYVLNPKRNSYMEKDYPGIDKAVQRGELYWLKWLGSELSPGYRRRIEDGELSAWARVGKSLVKKMTDFQKHQLLNLGAHVAHTGGVKPTEAWRFDKIKDTPILKKDGSNFFQIAKRVSL